MPLDYTVQEGVLRINRVEDGDQGEYICLARNRAGSQESSVSLFVEGTLVG